MAEQSDQPNHIHSGAEETAPPASEAQASLERALFGTLLSRRLPAYTGPHAVGAADVEAPVPRRTFRRFRVRGVGGDVGLVMDTVLFTLFYPVERPHGPCQQVVWFPRMRQTIDGLMRMAHRKPNFWNRALAYPIAAATIYGTTIPAYKDAPLLPPPSDRQKWPLLIFSHGVGCSRLMYSAFCGEMASRGYVVAALEHRDGTSPSSKITDAEGRTHTVEWLQWDELEWPDLDEQPTSDAHLRRAQLAMRCAEIAEAARIIRAVAAGADGRAHALAAPAFDWGRWCGVDPARPVMAGHSLGGSAALLMSANGDIPFRAVIAFDPGVRRVLPWAATIHHPLLVIHSEQSAIGGGHASFVAHVAPTTNAQTLLFAIPGATHPSFSDVFLILPPSVAQMTGMRAAAGRVLALAVDAACDFLDGNGDAVCRRSVRRAVGRGSPQRPLGEVGEMVWYPLERETGI